MMKCSASLPHPSTSHSHIHGNNPDRQGKSFWGKIRSESGSEYSDDESFLKSRLGEIALRIGVYITFFYLFMMLTLCDGQVELGFKSFGSPCDGPLECNRNLWLECHEGRCSCTQPRATIYKNNSSRCIGRVGSSCFQFGIGPYCQDNSICKLVQHLPSQVLSNPDHSPSSQFRYRARSQRQYQDQEYQVQDQYMGICQRILSAYGEDCDNDGDEDDDGNGNDVDVNQLFTRKCDERMKCLRGKCDCNPNQSQYHSKNREDAREKCSILPGGVCHPSWKNSACGKNSMCRPMNAEKTSFSCQCDHDSSSLDSTGECKRNYLKSCMTQTGPSRSHPQPRLCNQDRLLDCVDGVCICQNPLSQIYSVNYKRCVSLVGSRCSKNTPGSSGRNVRKLLKVADNSSREVGPELEGTSCTENAECVDVSVEKIGTCRCKRNYLETPAGTCEEDSGYGTVCQDGQCNHFKGMVCRRGQCLCLDPAMEYDQRRRACLSPLGYTCGKVSVEGIHSSSSNNSPTKIVSLLCSGRARCVETPSGRFKCSL